MEELKECRKKCRALESQLILSCSIIEWIEAIIDGEELGDFALSFPIVREVYDLYKRAQIDHECILERGEIIDRLS